jgi:hypothetical protein
VAHREEGAQAHFAEDYQEEVEPARLSLLGQARARTARIIDGVLNGGLRAHRRQQGCLQAARTQDDPQWRLDCGDRSNLSPNTSAGITPSIRNRRSTSAPCMRRSRKSPNPLNRHRAEILDFLGEKAGSRKHRRFGSQQSRELEECHFRNLNLSSVFCII